MAQVKDPVCGMMIDSDTAAGTSSFEGQDYYFCSEQCKLQFDSNPGHYQGALESLTADKEVELERHEPPYTKSGGMVAPKFGSAGSGGAEYERGPEKHRDGEDR